MQAAGKFGAAFTDKVPGSLVSFKMLPVPGKKIWMEETELPWDVFDIWQFSMDMTDAEKAKGVDAKSRPSKPYGAPDRGFGHAGYPNLSSTYKSGQFFCQWLSRKTGHKYRLPTAEEFEFAVAQGVMHQGATLLCRPAGHAHQVEHGQVLGICPGDRAERAEFPDPVRRADRAGTTDAGIPVRGVARIKLVAAADPVNLGRVHDRVAHGEGEIARHAEDIQYSDVLEPSQDVLDDRLRHVNPHLH